MKIDDWKKIELPDNPGVYHFMDEHGELLYVGKATSLRERTRSYFNTDVISSRGDRIVLMVDKASGLKWIETDSVLEALMLEAEHIKKYKPFYNAVGKDSKSYNEVVITDEPFPRIFTEREHVLTQGKAPYKIKRTYGPYPNGAQIREALKIIRRIFPFRDKKANNKSEERFYQQLQLTPDTSTEEARQNYLETVKNIELILKGKTSALKKKLKEDMMTFAKEEKFEEATLAKKQLFSLDHINDVSLIKREGNIDNELTRIEAYDISHLQGNQMVGVMTVVINGVVRTDEYRKFIIQKIDKANDTLALKQVLERRFNHPEWDMPTIVVMDGSTAQINVAKEILDAQQADISLVAVTKDDRHRPVAIKGNAKLIETNKEAILLANSESHRFAIKYHKLRRSKNFLK